MLFIPGEIPGTDELVIEGTVDITYVNSNIGTIEYPNATHVESERDFLYIRYGDNESITINRDHMKTMHIKETKTATISRDY